MSAELMISIICIGSASMSILFLISVTREIEVTPDKLIKIFGKENIENRDEQFKNIERLKKEYEAEGDPVLSMDVKKKS